MRKDDEEMNEGDKEIVEHRECNRGREKIEIESERIKYTHKKLIKCTLINRRFVT